MNDFFAEVLKIFHSSHPIGMLVVNIIKVISTIWNHQIYVTSDDQAILISNVVMGLVLFMLGFKIARHMSHHVKSKLPKTLDRSTASTLERISYYFFLIVITIIVMDIAHVPLTVFTVVGTTIALGIGLGSQNMANNFISGLIILIERPVKLGDIIEVKNIVGTVINIGARCVSIQTHESIIMLIPNSQILQDIVINWTHEDNMLKTGLIFEITNESSIDKFDSLIKEILHENRDVLKTPDPKILLCGLNDGSYRFEAEFWINLELNDAKYVINDINRKLIDISKDHDVKIISVSIIERPLMKV